MTGVPASPSGQSGLRPEPASRLGQSATVPNAGSFGSQLANQTERLLLLELRSGKATVRSLGVLYGLLMATSRSEDHVAGAFTTVNRAILAHFGDGPSGKLERIKKAAWDFFERGAAANPDAQGQSA